MTSALAPFRIGRGSSMSRVFQERGDAVFTLVPMPLRNNWTLVATALASGTGPVRTRRRRFDERRRPIRKRRRSLTNVDALYERSRDVHEQDLQYRHARKDH